MPIPSFVDRLASIGFKALLPFLRNRSFHCNPSVFEHPGNMQVHVLPALSDNFMYVIVDPQTKEAAVVDPVEPDKVINTVQELGIQLSTVLTTHHHWDHAGGNQDLVSKVAGLRVIGGDDRIPALNHQVTDGDTFKVGNLDIKCLSTPCHTRGHICYYVTSADTEPAVFTGDTLFIAGCGKFFEGDANQMYTALIDKLSTLPDATRVYCGHEYTLSNLKFAVTVEPGNQHILDKIAWSEEQKQNNKPTVPSTIGTEKLLNPFMRVREASIHSHTGSTDAIQSMAFLRQEKNQFKAK